MICFFCDIGIEFVLYIDIVFLAHLIGVYNDFRDWNVFIVVCWVGMFYLIYGIEMFQMFVLFLEQWDEVRELIGDYVEFVVWVNCVMD